MKFQMSNMTWDLVFYRKKNIKEDKDMSEIQIREEIKSWEQVVRYEHPTWSTNMVHETAVEYMNLFNGKEVE